MPNPETALDKLRRLEDADIGGDIRVAFVGWRFDVERSPVVEDQLSERLHVTAVEGVLYSNERLRLRGRSPQGACQPFNLLLDLIAFHVRTPGYVWPTGTVGHLSRQWRTVSRILSRCCLASVLEPSSFHEPPRTRPRRRLMAAGLYTSRRSATRTTIAYRESWGYTPREIERIRRLVVVHREELLRRWDEFFGE